MSNYHYGTGDCLQDLVTKLAESDMDVALFDDAWLALGVVVSALYRKSLRAPTNYSVCPHCGFSSLTKNATKLHVRRMHPS